MTVIFESVLDAMASGHVLVVGDVMLDRFVYGSVARISPEAPTPVIAASEEIEVLGGAANAARNIVALGARSTLVGIVGDDEAATRIRTMMASAGSLHDGLISTSDRPTTLKVRFVSPHHNTHLLRADWEASHAISQSLADVLLQKVESLLQSADIVLISDYAKGVLTPAVLNEIIALASQHGVPVVVDPKGRAYGRYRGATAITPNFSELSVAVGRELARHDEIIELAAREILEETQSAYIVVKRSEDGLQVVGSGSSLRLPTVAPRVVDVSGAGDTLAATLTLAMAAGAPIADAARIANAAAGLVVTKKGTAQVSMNELREFLLPRPISNVAGKIYSTIPGLQERIREWHADGLSVGFTNGCFDLLHPGHVFLLTQAKARVDRLIVGLNTDASVRHLKGPSRPVQNEEARATVMAALEAVDAVILFDDETPAELIAALVPDVLMKGADYRLDQVVGREVVEAAGGRVELIELVPESSTTRLVNRMREPEGAATSTVENA